MQRMSKETKPSQQDPSTGRGGDSGGSKGPQAPPPVKFSRGLMSWVMILGLLIMLFVVLNSNKSGQEIDGWTEFTVLIKNKMFKDNKVLIKDDRIVGTIKPGTEGYPLSTKARGSGCGSTAPTATGTWTN